MVLCPNDILKTEEGVPWGGNSLVRYWNTYSLATWNNWDFEFKDNVSPSDDFGQFFAKQMGETKAKEYSEKVWTAFEKGTVHSSVAKGTDVYPPHTPTHRFPMRGYFRFRGNSSNPFQMDKTTIRQWEGQRRIPYRMAQYMWRILRE